MAIDYGSTIASETTLRDIFASNPDPNMVKRPVTIGSGQVLLRGALLGIKTADSKYYALDTSATDGTQTLAGILVNDLDTTDAEEDTEIFISGDFNKDALTAVYTVAAGTYFNEFCNINIKEEV